MGGKKSNRIPGESIETFGLFLMPLFSSMGIVIKHHVFSSSKALPGETHIFMLFVNNLGYHYLGAENPPE